MHRDLKPENIIFRTNFEKNDAVIADLGLATRYDLKEYLFVRCGTPGFVAPEVVNIKDLHTTYDPVCDMYSLGVIFHILLFGKSPFNGKTYNDILSQNRAAEINWTDNMYKKIPDSILTVLKHMLEKDPKKRIRPVDALKH